MQKIQRVSQNFIRLFNLLLVILPLWTLLSWVYKGANPNNSIFPEGCSISHGEAHYELINGPLTQWTNMTKGIGFCGSLIHLLPTILGLFILRLLFKNYQKCAIFTLDNVRYYKKLGYLFFLHALITIPISDMMVILAATITRPEGERLIQIGFGTPSLTTLFCGSLIIVISWVMNEGYKLEEEQKHII